MVVNSVKKMIVERMQMQELYFVKVFQPGYKGFP